VGGLLKQNTGKATIDVFYISPF